MAEGYVKYRCEFIGGAPPSLDEILDINECRTRLKSIGLIGSYSDGVGFGNISKRGNASCEFLISATKTGGINILQPQHYTYVKEFSVEKNFIKCSGKMPASSEALTHAALYMANPRINAVIHIHSLELWKKLIHQEPTTTESAEYGTPEMALEIIRLLKEKDFNAGRIIVMAGHPEGIISYGENARSAEVSIMKLI